MFLDEVFEGWDLTDVQVWISWLEALQCLKFTYEQVLGTRHILVKHDSFSYRVTLQRMHLLLDQLSNFVSLAVIGPFDLFKLICRCSSPRSSLAATSLLVEYFAQDVLVIKQGAFFLLCLSRDSIFVHLLLLLSKGQVEAFRFPSWWPRLLILLFINQVLRITMIAFYHHFLSHVFTIYFVKILLHFLFILLIWHLRAEVEVSCIWERRSGVNLVVLEWDEKWSLGL